MDVAGRPFARVAPPATGSVHIAGTMSGVVHSLASMESHSGVREQAVDGQRSRQEGNNKGQRFQAGVASRQR